MEMGRLSVKDVCSSRHRHDVFTGSTRAGVAVAKGSADSVKRVHQELGGKSANIILDDADFANAVSRGTSICSTILDNHVTLLQECWFLKVDKQKQKKLLKK